MGMSRKTSAMMAGTFSSRKCGRHCVSTRRSMRASLRQLSTFLTAGQAYPFPYLGPIQARTRCMTVWSPRPHRADAVELMQIVAPMLAGHGTLLAQFHKFLPEGYRIDRLPRALSGYIRCHIDPSGVTYNNAEHLASTFVDRMLERFEGRPDVLNAVHAILSTTTLEDPSVPLVELDEPSSGAMKASILLMSRCRSRARAACRSPRAYHVRIH